ncbi:MAG: S41 family peptidase [Clostridia bacterium]
MKEQKKYRIYRVIMLVILVAFITFMITSIGFYQYFVKGKSLNKYLTLMTSNESKDISQTIDTYKSLIDKYFLGDVDESKLKEGAIKGYIEGLNDPYTEYISKEDMDSYLEDTKGNFVGIGIYMVKDEKTNKIKVLSPIKNSPAEKAGIQPGDLILTVDGVEYSGDDLTVISTKIKGEKDTSVKLQIQRNNEKMDFEIKRENIIVNPVEGEVLDNNIGYIEFSSFDENTSEQFKSEFEKLKDKGINSLIIDLRNNGGGIVDEALKIADYIADKDSVLLYEVDKNDKETVKKSENEPIINMPIVILTNGNTASSSEILAGALKDLGKAKTVGTKTYGKGIIQQILTLPDGSGLKITTEKYLTPNKTAIHKVGISPDEEVELPSDIDNVLNVEKEKDTQLQKAIELLK